MLRCVDWQIVSEVSDVSNEAIDLHLQDQAVHNDLSTAVQDPGLYDCEGTICGLSVHESCLVVGFQCFVPK
jgi:hypothetical protein